MFLLCPLTDTLLRCSQGGSIDEWRARGRSLMSGVRRAMQEMGLAICCLVCDAPDDTSSPRCRTCIGNHRDARDRLQQFPDERLASQWARELFQMNARPNAYEHDSNHGVWMRTYARLLAGPPELHRKITQADVEAAFAASRAERDVNPLRDIANQSPWKDAPPSDEEVRRFEKQLPTDVEYSRGRPTIPSKVIPEVDRSSRSGEDHELADRVLGAAAAQTAPSDLRDLTPELTAGERRLTRRLWKDLVDEIDALIEE